jgi:hypothetical protein
VIIAKDVSQVLLVILDQTAVFFQVIAIVVIAMATLLNAPVMDTA